MRAHVIENGKVVNTIVVDDLNVLPNLIEATEGEIGWLYDGTTFSPPPRNLEEEWKQVIARRDELLFASNHHVAPDLWAAMTEQEREVWTTYRQYLRDIKNLFSDPKDVVWLPDPANSSNEPNQIGVSYV
jgi:hypothetical protein